MRSTMARPILLPTGFCLSDVAVMKNYALGVSDKTRQSWNGETDLVLNVDKVLGMSDRVDVRVGD